jgi:hypothetical protein
MNDDEESMAAAVAAGIEGIDVEDSPAPSKQRRPRKPHMRAAASEEVASWAEASWRALGKVGRTASGKAKAMVTALEPMVGARPIPTNDEDKMAVEHQMGKTQLLLYVGAHRGCTANSFQVAEDLRRIEGGHLYPTAYEAALAHDELIRKMQPQENLRLVNYSLPGSGERQFIPSTRTVRRAAQIQLPLPTLIDGANMGGPEAIGNVADDDDEEEEDDEDTRASEATSTAGPAATSAQDMAAMEAEAQAALADIGGLEGPSKKARHDDGGEIAAAAAAAAAYM